MFFLLLFVCVNFMEDNAGHMRSVQKTPGGRYIYNMYLKFKYRNCTDMWMEFLQCPQTTINDYFCAAQSVGNAMGIFT